MTFSLSKLSYQQKSNVAEISYLVFISIISPFAVGLQIFDRVSFMLSLILGNVLSLPVIILFYRVYLPQTIGRQKYLMFILLLPVYLILYELNSRLSSITLVYLPFIPTAYSSKLIVGNLFDLSKGYFRQTIGYTSLVLLAATSLYVIKLLFKNQHNLYAAETEKLQMELSYLKEQIQPHFFFNTLNNLYSLTVQHSAKAPEMITDLSAIMRYVLYDAQQEKVSLEQEIAFIRSYIHLENLRHDRADLVSFSVQGNVSGAEIEPLLFLPLIENTFKHALHLHQENKTVKLVLDVDEGEIIFQTSNAKVTIPQSLDKTASGIGLENVKKRLHLLYPNRHELIIYDEKDTFTVTLTIQRTS